MVKRLMLAVAMVAVLAAPSFAAVQNVKVGGDLKTTSVLRKNFIAGTGYSADAKSQNAFLSQIGVNVQADLTDNVATNLRFTNERIWGTDQAGLAAGNDHLMGSALRVDTASVTMKEMLYAPLTVTVGRQPLAYGNQLIIGDGDATTDVASLADITGGVNFDAIKAVLSYDPLTVDVFASKVSENSSVGQNDDNDTDLFGINANYKLGDKMSTVVEGYVFASNDKSGVSATETKGDRLYVPGLRVSTNPIEGLNVQLEGAYQFGSEEYTSGTGHGKDVQAYALQGGVNYALPVLKDMKPVLSAGYTYLSGDEDTTALDSKTKAWKPMYENQNTGRIFDTLDATNTNVKIASLSAEITPVQDVTTKLSWYNLTKAKKNVTSSYIAKSKIGDEIDLDVTYAYTEDVKFGVSAGLFVPGQANGATNQDNASQVLSSVSVAF